jgi:hypothetical protein
MRFGLSLPLFWQGFMYGNIFLLGRLKCELKRERLRADFYEEMVAFGKEVYGIDLKKAGTK